MTKETDLEIIEIVIQFLTSNASKERIQAIMQNSLDVAFSLDITICKTCENHKYKCLCK